ncbi:hypothetical protein GCM10027187_41400 [Streptosporangium sandarakinum]|uniref:poly(ethylene terephthalate) hydrolase n=1 Tax=Streptosporangium sandarakinum TaxID=1260955 RepID=A0A852V791_9ACTN|nr:hypothetical protein [Streptosporangium sandarakinum]
MKLNGASHFFPQTPNTTMAKYMISWMKRFIDDDTRYRNAGQCSGLQAGGEGPRGSARQGASVS